jgi:hypothetical protein
MQNSWKQTLKELIVQINKTGWDQFQDCYKPVDNIIKKLRKFVKIVIGPELIKL